MSGTQGWDKDDTTEIKFFSNKRLKAPSRKNKNLQLRAKDIT